MNFYKKRNDPEALYIARMSGVDLSLLTIVADLIHEDDFPEIQKMLQLSDNLVLELFQPTRLEFNENGTRQT